MHTITECDVFGRLPVREKNSNKGKYGTLLLVCGSSRFRGAAQLAAAGALRCGTGIVTLASTEVVIASVLSAGLPECTCLPLPSAEDGTIGQGAAASVLSGQSRFTAAAVGCGLGQSSSTRLLTTGLTEGLSCPLVLDADALNLLAKDPDILKKHKGPAVLTPHPGEMARLCGCTVSEIQSDRIGYAARIAADTGCVVVLKGHDTLIALPDGGMYLNETGNAGLAKGGSGDILCGMIAGLLAQGLSAADAAVCGVWLHGAAADLCASRKSMTCMLPHEILEDLSTLYFRHSGM